MRARKFEVAGIYNTNLTDYDKSLVFTDLHTIRRLNGWDSTMVSGCEIEVPNSNDIEVYSTTLKNRIDLLINMLSKPTIAKIKTYIASNLYDNKFK